MTDDRLLPFDLPAVWRKKVLAVFDGGLVLLREAERRLGISAQKSFKRPGKPAPYRRCLRCGFRETDVASRRLRLDYLVDDSRGLHVVVGLASANETSLSVSEQKSLQDGQEKRAECPGCFGLENRPKSGGVLASKIQPPAGRFPPFRGVASQVLIILVTTAEGCMLLWGWLPPVLAIGF